MVKVGFIVEGDSEKIVVESQNFRDFLQKQGFELVTPVVNAKGGGNLLPQNIDAFLQILGNKHIQQIVVLTDLEDAPSIDAVKNRIANQQIDAIFVAVKALEAWFLADGLAIATWLSEGDFHEVQPEQTVTMPWERLKQIATERNKRGPGNKVGFAKKMVKHGFCVTHAAQHPACPSARKLVEWFENQ